MSKYISQLLLTHDCVIIPGFGGFIGNYNSSIYNEKNSYFLPPSKAILFNKNLVSNDGLLINYIAQENNIPYINARIEVQSFVEQLYFALDKGTVVLNDIGEIKYDNNKNLLFEPFNYSNFLIDSFGLEAFSFPQLDLITNEIVARKFSNSFKKRRNIAKYLVAPIAIALLLSPIKTNIFVSQKAKDLFNIDSNQNYATSPIEQTIDYLTDKKVALFYQEDTNPKGEIPAEKNIQIKEPETKIAEIEENIVKETPSESYFEKGYSYIIAGCFKESSNVEVLKSEYASKNISATVFVDKGMYKISLGKHKTRELANTELREIRNKDKNIQAWVMSN